MDRNVSTTMWKQHSAVSSPQVDHPSLWKFADSLCHIQKERYLLFELMVTGNLLPVKRQKYY